MSLLFKEPALHTPRRDDGAAGAHDDAITRAIRHLAEHWDAPPSLDELAHEVAEMSPAHFQRRFKARVGISPKRFCQQLTLTRAKRLLARRVSLLDAALRSDER